MLSNDVDRLSSLSAKENNEYDDSCFCGISYDDRSVWRDYEQSFERHSECQHCYASKRGQYKI
jgi:hypothetical protein